jgi:hypothetical protein
VTSNTVPEVAEPARKVARLRDPPERPFDLAGRPTQTCSLKHGHHFGDLRLVVGDEPVESLVHGRKGELARRRLWTARECSGQGC